MLESKFEAIIKFVKANQPAPISAIHKGIEIDLGLSTVRKYLKKLINDNLLKTEGTGKALKYLISESYQLFFPIDLDAYYQTPMDDRDSYLNFNLKLIPEILANTELFSDEEIRYLENIQSKYLQNIEPLTKNEFNKELERLAIDLSWKSGEIEGNTYTLLETEALIKYHEIAEGKKQEDAQMLLNHKDALDFIISDPDYLTPISVSKIEDIHSILIKNLDVDRNIRKRGVAIGGTLYKPLNIQSQIIEAMEQLCELVNNKSNAFEKALLIVLLISYIQPFNDGNIRTARIVGNALLMNSNHCPLTYRTIKASEYKKAMLLFYEQNNLTAFKKIFINQYEFAVNTYFNL